MLFACEMLGQVARITLITGKADQLLSPWEKNKKEKKSCFLLFFPAAVL